MTTERTLRITDEMVDRLLCYQFGLTGPSAPGSWQKVTFENARKSLEAALEPYLERRNGERRQQIRLATPHDLGGHSPNCPAAQMFINPEPHKIYHCKCRGESKQEQNKAPEIHVSEGMLDAARDIWFKYAPLPSQSLRPVFAMAYRAMEAQRLKEQGWDGLGPGGA